MAILPNPNQRNTTSAPTDWVGVSKILCVEVAFLASVGVLLFGRPSSDLASQALGIAVATGATLGILRITDVVANVVNVRSFLGSSTAQAGALVPVAPGTPLVVAPTTPTTGQTNGGSH